jgi:hypothetical protein
MFPFSILQRPDLNRTEFQRPMGQNSRGQASKQKLNSGGIASTEHNLYTYVLFMQQNSGGKKYLLLKSKFNWTQIQRPDFYGNKTPRQDFRWNQYQMPDSNLTKHYPADFNRKELRRPDLNVTEFQRPHLQSKRKSGDQAFIKPNSGGKTLTGQNLIQVVAHCKLIRLQLILLQPCTW